MQTKQAVKTIFGISQSKVLEVKASMLQALLTIACTCIVGIKESSIHVPRFLAKLTSGIEFPVLLGIRIRNVVDPPTCKC